MSQVEQERWELDAVINERGFYTDIALATAREVSAQRTTPAQR